jgi:hypothetical protein
VPIPIAHLFHKKDDYIHKMPDHEDMEEMSKTWPSIPIELNELPNYPYPENGSSAHKKDISVIQGYFFNPVNSREFLNLSNDKPFKVFSNYTNKNNLKIDLEVLDELNKELSRIILNLKFKFNRPRPKKYLESIQSEFPYNRIESNDSPSYPSGHTAHAFFNAQLISHFNPEYEMKLRSLAELIGQSRIDLGRHYPSDIDFGRFLGEYIAKQFIDNSKGKLKINESIDISNKSNQGRRKLVKFAKNHNKNNLGTTYIDELCEFLIRSNEIERYAVDIQSAYDASESFMRGLPVKYCTDNKYLRSHLDALDVALNFDKIDTPKKVQMVHKALGDDVIERGMSGEFRQFPHHARSGYQYSEPGDILTEINDWCSLNTTAFKRHIVYECIHPFGDGNGRSGRILMLSDLNYDIAKINDLIGNNYIDMLTMHQDSIGK